MTPTPCYAFGLGKIVKTSERLETLNGLLLGNSPLETRLGRFADSAHSLLKSLDLADFLARTLGVGQAEAIVGAISGYLHLGFLAPPHCQASDLAAAADKAGFNTDISNFASEVMSRELSQKAAHPVPTTIFKAFAEASATRKNGLEAFIPEVQPERLVGWVTQGVGTHLGIGLKQRDSVWQAVQVCRTAGFEPPDFLRGEPAVNQAEDILVIYADGQLQGRPLRLEFYHAASEAPLGRQ